MNRSDYKNYVTVFLCSCIAAVSVQISYMCVFGQFIIIIINIINSVRELFHNAGPMLICSIVVPVWLSGNDAIGYVSEVVPH